MEFIRIRQGSLLCTIERYRIVDESYVEYLLTVKSDFKTWTLGKRFSEFYRLSQSLSGKIEKVPSLPSRFTLNFIVGVIEHRCVELEKFANNLLSRDNLPDLPDILDFFAINREELLLFNFKKYSMSQKTKVKPVKVKRYSKSTVEQSNPRILPEQSKIYSFLKEINKNVDDIVNRVSSFSLSFSKLTLTDTKLLIYGDKAVELKGLLRMVASLTGRAKLSCLGLLSQLLDYAYNPKADQARILLSKCHSSNIKVMNLGKLILNSNFDTKIHCKNVIEAYLQGKNKLNLLLDQVSQSSYLIFVNSLNNSV